MLDYLYYQLGQLAVVNNLPEIGVPPTGLLNRALDVRSATLIYISVHIHQESRFGITGMFALYLKAYLPP